MNLVTNVILASFWTSKGMLWISQFVENHLLIVQTILILVIFALVPRSWNERSDRFEKKHQRFLWAIIILIFLLIPIVAYLMWRFL